MVQMLFKDLLSVNEGIIVQQVNCQGVMGAGLAKAIRNKWPIVYAQYANKCRAVKDKETLLGETQFVWVGENLVVVNVFGQLNFGRKKDVTYTDYDALECAMRSVHKYARAYGLQVFIPWGLGCGLANGDWDIVQRIIEHQFWGDVLCTICMKDD